MCFISASCLEIILQDFPSSDTITGQLFGGVIEFELHPNSQKGSYGKQQGCHDNTRLKNDNSVTVGTRILLSTKLYLLMCSTSIGQFSYER